MKKPYTGWSLIEVLVSLLILSFIVLGLDSLEIYALETNQSAYFLSVAESQLHVITERLRAGGHSEQLGWIAAWNKQNSEFLPQGRGDVSGIFPNYQIDLYWGKKRINHLMVQVMI